MKSLGNCIDVGAMVSFHNYRSLAVLAFLLATGASAFMAPVKTPQRSVMVRRDFGAVQKSSPLCSTSGCKFDLISLL